MLFTRDAAPKGAKIQKVDLSAWAEIDQATGKNADLHVFVRELSVAEKDAFDAKLWKGKGQNREIHLTGSSARLIVLCACDENGNRLFQNSDEDFIQKQPAAMMTKIYATAMLLNGYVQQDEEELLKN